MCFLFKSQILSCEIWRCKSICRWKLVLRCYSCGTSVSTLACWHVVNVGPFLQLHTNSHAMQPTYPYHLSRLPSYHQSLSHLIHLSSNFSSHIILSPVCYIYMLFSQKLCCFPPFPTSKILQWLESISKLPKNVFRPKWLRLAGSSQPRPVSRYCCNGNLNDLLVRCGRPGLGEGLVRRLLAEVPVVPNLKMGFL